MQKIPDDTQILNSQIEQIIAGNQGISASSNKAIEDQLTDVYNDVSAPEMFVFAIAHDAVI